MSYPAISLTTASVGRQRCPRKRLQIALRLPAYLNSSPDHRACNSLTHLPLSSRRIYVYTGGFELIGPDDGALRGTGAGSLPTLHGGIVEGTADMGTVRPCSTSRALTLAINVCVCACLCVSYHAPQYIIRVLID